MSPTPTPTRQFPRAPTPDKTRETANATFAAIVSAFATKTPFVGTAVPVIERVIVGRDSREIALPGDDQRLGDILARQRNDFGCGAYNGGFDYAFGNRYLVFLLSEPDATPRYGSIFPMKQPNELGFSHEVSRAVYDAFFSDLEATVPLGAGPVFVRYSRISLDRVVRAIHAIRSGAISPPDTGSAGLASTRSR